ncbi:hypothetical protein GOP47_0013327 [Adiantum capillus-veneris]|uniref:mitogen-activated protein kinase kinase kinase n=1 Tax=Adiantum capillus-veneris TaxID=13818 RepID=A0A9D4UNH5_ADICA|nr:hypothetical protein GOP47_0013327 [Adiantum capillus-veneris]
MPAMASLSKHSSSGKPKLERRLARKISDYEPSTDSPSPSSSYRAIDKGASKSFRVIGYDSKEEIEKICEELGLAGGADAFSIPQEAWEAGKAKAGSLDRFILDHKARSRSLDEPPGRFFGHCTGDELASSPLSATQSLSPSPFYNSMSSSSGDSFASDSSLIVGEKGFLGPVDVPKEQALPHSIVRGPQVPEDRHQTANALFTNHSRLPVDNQHTANPLITHESRVHVGRQQSSHHQVKDLDMHARPHNGSGRPPGKVVHEQPIHDARIHEHDNSDQADDLKLYDFERLSKSVDQLARVTLQSNQPTLLPPPVLRAKAYLPLLSTQELLAGFGPNENTDGNNQQASDGNDTSPSNSEGSEADDVEDTKEQFGFVTKVVLQHSDSAKEQIHAEDVGGSVPQTPERRASDVSIQSWRKLDLLGSGSFGTVYEGLSEDGIYFAVKEVSLSENDSKAQQCVTQLEQEIEFLSKFQHENIVQYLGTQKESDKLYIFLELVTKGSLSSLYQKYTLFDSQIRSYTRQILSGLKYLHERKVMHRDIKCANILVDVSGKVKLADFGLAKQISQLDELKSCKGSAYWMAPEVIDPRKTYSLPADIWSLGCTVLEMATRRPPFGDMEWHRALWKVGHGEAPPIPETLSEEAKDFIKNCLEVNPLRRPSASKLLEHPFVQHVGGTVIQGFQS